jgi:enoyl-CoA hydratase/carnithine racemase
MPVTAKSSEPEVLLRDDNAGVATLTLNRPDQYNALSDEMIDALSATLTDIGRDESIRVVVLAGAGRAFCAGHDLRQMRAREDRAYYMDLLARCTAMMSALIEIPQPVIARVHGIATAAGCQLVATCDLAIASREARFAISGVNLGLFCSTPIVALSRNVPVKRAFEMGVTGDFIDAETAAELGLVNRAVPPAELDAAVAALSGKIVAKPAVAVATGKRLFYRQLESSRSAAYEVAASAMIENLMHGDACEGIDAFLEKRSPSWNR